MFTVILRSFSAFSIFPILENIVSRKRLTVVPKLQFRPWWYVLSTCIYGYWWPLSVQWHSELIRCIFDFSDFPQPCISKTAGLRMQWTTILVSGVVLIAWYFGLLFISRLFSTDAIIFIIPLVSQKLLTYPSRLSFVISRVLFWHLKGI